MRNLRSKLLVTPLLALGALTGGASQAQAAGPSFTREASFAGNNDAFYGYSVAIDGTTAVVGALNDSAGAGAAYVYVLNGSTWSLQQQLVAPDAVANDEFGYTVAVSGDTVVVGAAGKAGGEGCVYAFTRTGSTWALQQELTESVGAADDCFGCALALRGDTVVIGADGASGGVGAAYVFARSGAAWAQQAEFLGLAASDYFGFSVGLSPAGDLAVVGAFGAAGGAGSAYVFTRSGSSWSQPQPPLTALDGKDGDRFGYAVAAGAGTLLVGAYLAGGAGAAYVFALSGGVWMQQQKIVAADPTGSDAFGASVAIDANTAVVGAYEHGGALGPGAAYVFTSAGAGFTQAPAELFATTGEQSFGYAVAVSGPKILVGGFGASGDSGAASLFSAATSIAQAPALGSAGAAGLMLLLVAAGSLAGRPRRGVSAS